MLTDKTKINSKSSSFTNWNVGNERVHYQPEDRLCYLWF